MASPDDLAVRRTALEDRIDTWGVWLIWSIVPVVIGLAMECYAVLDLIWSHDWNRLIDRIGLILVTVGVAGELLVESKTHGAERCLRRINEDIGRESDKYIAELNAKAETEYNARTKLQSQMAGRYISSKQALVLKEKLKPWRGMALIIAAGIETSEAWWLTLRLDEIMGAKGCQWDAFINRDKPLHTLPVDGVHILPSLPERSQQAGIAIGLALNEIGIKSLTPGELMETFSGVDRGPHFLERFWPPGTWHPEKEAVLIVINDKPLPERPDL